MPRLHAQPYNIDAGGFFFDSETEFAAKSTNHRDRFGHPVEEYEIQFIDGERLDAELVSTLPLNQANLSLFYDLVERWEDHEKIRFIIANGECGYQFDPACDDIDQLDIDIYEVDSLKELAKRFVDEGLFGDVPEAFQNYIDYDAIARDLSVEYATTTIDGEHIAYRCG